MWSDPQLIKLADKFVPAADEVWHLQRGSDAECRLFQSMAEVGHYGHKPGTRQGIYVCTPAGLFLTSINSLNADSVYSTLETALAKWEQLPNFVRAQRPPMAVEPEHRWEASYPDGGLVLVSVNRDLLLGNGQMSACEDRWNRDHVWFTKDEARAWLAADPLPGSTHDVPQQLVRRLARFHLVDNVRGQTLPFAEPEVEGASMHTKVIEREGSRVRLRISGATSATAEGPWLMGESNWTPTREYPRAMATQVFGYADYDLDRSAFTRFEMVAVGRWRGGTENNDRRDKPHSGVIGFFFSLAPGTPAERVPPAFIDIYDAPWVVQSAQATKASLPSSLSGP